MKYNPYFLFDGKAEEATNLYAKAFNGQSQIMKYKDAPPNPDFQMPEEMKELVMHSEVRFDNMVFMICDATPMQPAKIGNNVQVSFTFENKESFQKVYDILSDGSKIAVAPEANFFAEYYASFEDKFGVTWQLIVPKAM
jgi:PhnB protein